MTKPGNDLLKDVFLEQDQEFRETEELIPFDPREPVGSLKKFNPSALKPLPSSIDNENLLPVVLDEIAEKGIHAIAWYLPYRIFGEKRWGIYFDTFAMNRLSFEIGTIARQLDHSISNTSARKVLYAEVMRHELEHAVQELLIAKALKNKSITRASVKSANFSKKGSYREVIASHFEHFDKLEGLRGEDGRHVEILRFVMKNHHKPGVYNRWRSESIESLDSTYEIDLGILANIGEASSTERKLFGGKRSSKYIDIPTYSWLGNGLRLPLTGVDLRAQSIPCKKLERFMIKDGLAKYFQGELRAIPASDHSLKIVNHSLRPIKFDCHDWDIVPDRVISQLSVATGLNKFDFVDRIRKHI